MGDLNIENTNIKTAAGVSLDEQQKTMVGTILDVSSSHCLSTMENPSYSVVTYDPT